MSKITSTTTTSQLVILVERKYLLKKIYGRKNPTIKGPFPYPMN